MAQITYTGFVEDWTQNSPQHPEWGMKTAEPHRKKDGDQWVTTARTFRTVKGGYTADGRVAIDFTQFRKGDRVKVTGTEATEVRESNGKKYYDLVCKATSVEVVPAHGAAQQPQSRQAADWDAPAKTGAQGASGGQAGSWGNSAGYTESAPF